MTTEDVLLAQSLALSAARLKADGFQPHELAYNPDEDSDVELLPDLELQALFVFYLFQASRIDELSSLSYK